MSLLLLFNQPSSGTMAAGLKRNSSLSGLGASGPFFHDILASIALLIAVFGALV